jgi:hypothetical protein
MHVQSCSPIHDRSPSTSSRRPRNLSGPQPLRPCMPIVGAVGHMPLITPLRLARVFIDELMSSSARTRSSGCSSGVARTLGTGRDSPCARACLGYTNGIGQLRCCRSGHGPRLPWAGSETMLRKRPAFAPRDDLLPGWRRRRLRTRRSRTTAISQPPGRQLPAALLGFGNASRGRVTIDASRWWAVRKAIDAAHAHCPHRFNRGKRQRGKVARRSPAPRRALGERAPVTRRRQWDRC